MLFNNSWIACLLILLVVPLMRDAAGGWLSQRHLHDLDTLAFQQSDLLWQIRSVIFLMGLQDLQIRGMKKFMCSHEG